MNKKGDMGMVGALLIAFVGIMVGLILFSDAIAPNIGDVTNTVDVVDEQLTMPGSGDTVNLQGKHASDFVLRNDTTTIDEGNYTVLNNQLDSTTGELTAQLQADTSEFDGQTVFANYTYQPTGYITDAGGRGIAGLIAIFLALAIMMLALTPSMRQGLMSMFGK